MYERLYLNVFYSGLFYIDVSEEIDFTASDFETNNVVQSLPGNDLKNVIVNTLPTTTLYNYLKTTAGENQEGESWQTFISQNFVTKYINSILLEIYKLKL